MIFAGCQLEVSLSHLQFLEAGTVPCHVGFSNMAAYFIKPTGQVYSSSLPRHFFYSVTYFTVDP